MLNSVKVLQPFSAEPDSDIEISGLSGFSWHLSAGESGSWALLFDPYLEADIEKAE